MNEIEKACLYCKWLTEIPDNTAKYDLIMGRKRSYFIYCNNEIINDMLEQYDASLVPPLDFHCKFFKPKEGKNE